MVILNSNILTEGASGRVDEHRVCVYAQGNDSEILAVVDGKNRITKHAQVEL
jgi:hypothetical protein